MTFEELAAKRCSIRSYTDRPVEREKLEKMLAAGNLAPTAKNFQPHRIYVVQTPEMMKKLTDLTPCTFGAGTVLVFTYRTDEEWKNPFEPEIHSGVEDVSIVATHMMLEAEELGLATCWVNYFPNSRVEKALGLPAEEKVVLLMPVGYAAADAAPGPNHTKKKDLSEIVRWC